MQDLEERKGVEEGERRGWEGQDRGHWPMELSHGFSHSAFLLCLPRPVKMSLISVFIALFRGSISFGQLYRVDVLVSVLLSLAAPLFSETHR